MITTRTAALALALAVAVLAQPVGASLPPDSDVKDVYVFESQEDPDRLVFAVTFTNSSSDVQSFDNRALYEFKVDTNGDYVEDAVIQATFTGSGEHQQVTIHGPSVPEVVGGHGKVVRGETLSGDVSLADSPTILSRPGYAVRAFAGLRDDPAFWDEDRKGADQFAGQNVLAIVVEVRRDTVVPQGVSVINVWATVSQVLAQPA